MPECVFGDDADPCDMDMSTVDESLAQLRWTPVII